MKTTNNILLVRIPEVEANRLRELRDFILQSLDKSVLVLPEDASYEVMELPPLGGVMVEAKEQPDLTPEAEGQITNPELPAADQSGGRGEAGNRSAAERLSEHPRAGLPGQGFRKDRPQERSSYIGGCAPGYCR